MTYAFSSSQAWSSILAESSYLDDGDPTFYLCITPNPQGTGQMHYDVDGNLRLCWWIKIGDGKFRPAYRTENPDIGMAENAKSKASKTMVYCDDKQGKRNIDVRNGKAYEYGLFKERCDTPSVSEWYRIWAENPKYDAKLRDMLVETLQIFGSLHPDAVIATLEKVLDYCCISPKNLGEAQEVKTTNVIKYFPSESHSIPQTMNVSIDRWFGKSQAPRAGYKVYTGPPTKTKEQAYKHSLYFAVAPNPFKTGQITYGYPKESRRCQWWWVKIGDGVFRNSYLTHNPDIKGEENHNLTTELLVVEEKVEGNHRTLVVRNGKAFELSFLKGEAEGNTKASRSEWYGIRARSQDDDRKLQERLKSVLNGFSSYTEDSLGKELGVVLNTETCEIVLKRNLVRLS